MLRCVTLYCFVLLGMIIGIHRIPFNTFSASTRIRPGALHTYSVGIPAINLIHSVAQGLSALLNPLAVAAGLVISYGLHSGARLGFQTGLSLLFGVVLPAFYVLHLRRKGEIDRLFVAEKTGRLKPLRFTAVSCLGGWAALVALEASSLLAGLMLAFASNAALAAVYTYRWRLSLHSVGAWGGLAASGVILGGAGLLLSPLAIAASWSRLYLKAHSVPEVLAGAAVGAGSTWLVLTGSVTFTGN